jgi:hypothetical protein
LETGAERERCPKCGRPKSRDARQCRRCRWALDRPPARTTLWLNDGTADKLEEMHRAEKLSKSEILRGLIEVEYARWKKEQK